MLINYRIQREWIQGWLEFSAQLRNAAIEQKKPLLTTGVTKIV